MVVLMRTRKGLPKADGHLHYPSEGFQQVVQRCKFFMQVYSQIKLGISSMKSILRFEMALSMEPVSAENSQGPDP